MAVAAQNDLPFTFAPAFAGGRIPEKTKVPAVIGQLSADSAAATRLTLNCAGAKLQYESRTGQLSLIKPVDYEEACQLHFTLETSTKRFLGSCEVIPQAPISIRYIKPNGSGTQDGSSLANAAPITALEAMLATTPPGGQVRIIADAGVYNVPRTLSIASGGTEGNPKLIAGFDSKGNRMKAQIIGSRTPWTLPTDPEQVTDIRKLPSKGNDLFALKRPTASNVTFRDFDVKHVASFTYIDEDMANISIDSVDVYNCNCAFSSDVVTITNYNILNTTVTGFTRDAVRLRKKTANVLIEDFHYNSGRQAGEFAVGIYIDENAHDIVIRSSNPDKPSIVENCSDCRAIPGEPQEGYANCDGIATEGGNRNIWITDVTTRGHTDGGVDLKSAQTTLVRIVSEDNKRNYRLWNPVDHTLIDCASRNPRSRAGTSGTEPTHVWTGNGVDLLVDHFEMQDNDPNALGFNPSGAADLIRMLDVSYQGKGTLEANAAGATFLKPLPDDFTPPKFTNQTAFTVQEGARFTLQLTTDDAEPVLFERIAGDSQMVVSPTGQLALSNCDYDAPQDNDRNNVYRAQFLARDIRRNESNIWIEVTVTDKPGDTGGSVTETTSHGWRWHPVFIPASVQLSGPEGKTATQTAKDTFTIVRGSAGIYPPLHHQHYFELQPTFIGNPSTFAVGMCNASENRQAPLGATNHSIGYYADGNLKINNTSVAALPPYSAKDVIGLAVDLGKWDYADVAQNPGHIENWRIRKLWIYKNGQLVTPEVGVNISALTDALYSAAGLYSPKDSVIARSSDAEFTESPRSGFKTWGTVRKLAVTGNGARYIRTGGTGDGMSWATAASLNDLSGMIGSAQAGGTINPHVFIRADEGVYNQTSQIIIQDGGASERNSVVVTGATEDLIPLQFVTQGTRKTWVLPNNSDQNTEKTNTFGGNDLFRLATGANNLVFRNLCSTRHQCSFYIMATSNNVTIEDCEFYNCRRGMVETAEGPKTEIAANDWLVRQINGVGFSKPGIHFRGSSKRDVIENCYLNAGLQTGDKWSVGVKFSGDAEQGTIRSVYALNMREPSTGFSQGDGFEVNNGNDLISIENCVAYRCRDAGFDSKSDGGKILKSLADSCTRVKVWGDLMEIEDLFVYRAGQPLFHNGQGSGKSWITWRRVRLYDGGKPAHLHFQNPHIVDRFIDCYHIDTTFRTLPLNDPVVQQIFDSTGKTTRHLFGTAGDTVPPQITTNQASYTVPAGERLAIPLTANEPVTWAIKNGTYSFELRRNRCSDSNFQIDLYSQQNNQLKFLNDAEAIYDTANLANNVKKVIVEATDANNNISEKAFSVTIRQ